MLGYLHWPSGSLKIWCRNRAYQQIKYHDDIRLHEHSYDHTNFNVSVLHDELASFARKGGGGEGGGILRITLLFLCVVFYSRSSYTLINTEKCRATLCVAHVYSGSRHNIMTHAS